ncbi:DNA polymerase-3 subunit epsilon [Streptococcus henryi]|uniref:DNA polymerase-3 subunit epsilon n=1 Tax=Streptococcus henryi TaxID=439219 RepID=A0A1G6AMX2_9STRE|nr:3'-5' exonuclease [Streptococcus henryi]SDB09748.1 DNA polymerase-3 subunit epsilon [Streptococcus henryi]
MKTLKNYIAFDLEFNTVNDISHIIQVSAVKFEENREVDQFDTYVYTDVPLQSFINGLTGITAEKIAIAPKVEKVMSDFQTFVGETALIGYNGLKSDLPLLVENGLDLTELYQVDVFDEAFERRSTDLNGIRNLQLHTVAEFLGFTGRSHNSLEDARMTAQVYEKFMELDDNKSYLNQQEESHGDNPFAALGGFFS